MCEFDSVQINVLVVLNERLKRNWYCVKAGVTVENQNI